MKTYSNKSNARRAAKAAGLDLETITFVQNAEGWYWEAIEVSPVQLKVEGPEGLEPGLHTATIQNVEVVGGKLVMTAKVDQAVAEAIAEVDTRAEDAALAASEPIKPEAAAEPVVATPKTKGLKIERNRDEQNGVKRPSAGSTCRQLWDMFDAMYAEKGIVPTPTPAKAKSAEQGLSPVTTTVQLYQWRAFMGFKGR